MAVCAQGIDTQPLHSKMQQSVPGWCCCCFSCCCSISQRHLQEVAAHTSRGTALAVLVLPLHVHYSPLPAVTAPAAAASKGPDPVPPSTCKHAVHIRMHWQCVAAGSIAASWTVDLASATSRCNSREPLDCNHAAHYMQHPTCA
jgi:streptolysin S family bacteriocin protoxin